MRQLLGERKLNRYRRIFPDLKICKGLVRGGTDHRVDLCLEDGTVMHLWPDGTLTKSEIGWKPPEAK